MIKFFIVFISILFTINCFAQPGKSKYDIADADEHYSHHNFLMALPIYKEILKTDKTNASIQYKIAECYLNTHINKSEAIKTFINEMNRVAKELDLMCTFYTNPHGLISKSNKSTAID